MIACVEQSNDDTVTVLEVSSFQLEWIDTFRPDVSVILNITPDHLDRHVSFAEYLGAKLRIFENQTGGDFAILNADDPVLARQKPPHASVCWFSRTQPLNYGASIRGQEIVFRDARGETVLLQRSDSKLRGEHNVENVLAAAAAAWLLDTPAAAIAAGVRSFSGVEHRIEFVAEVAGVQYFNDSKATNVDAALKAIDAFSGGLYVILGGKDKGSDYTLLIEPLRQRAKSVLLIGAAAEKIAAQIGGSVAVVRAGTLDRAVAMASECAQPGDTVLLAPACASFDQFENYEHRGRVFKQLVRGIEAARLTPGATARA
jgi:UDP-N-acetylmuramoylalanine--D-glutamate ligase